VNFKKILYLLGNLIPFAFVKRTVMADLYH